MLCGTDNIPQNILIFRLNEGIFHGILLVPQNIIMDLNNGMSSPNIFE